MKKVFAMTSILILSGCSSSPDVVPGVDGFHKISLRGETAKDTEGRAHKQARSFCKDQKKTVDFLSDDTVKATPAEVMANPINEGEAVATELRFKCI